MREIIEVLEPGLFSTIQDLGRYGYQRYGVPVSGAMDSQAMRMSNILLGNEEGAATLEITLIGPKLRFLEESIIALCGADLVPRVNGEVITMYSSVRVRKGSILSFDGPSAGSRCYMAVPNGFHVPTIMQSKSTYVQGSIGGYAGRTLKSGDLLSCLQVAQSGSLKSISVPETLIPLYTHDYKLNVIMGPQCDAFPQASIHTFLNETYTIANQSDRIGYRLTGPPIGHLNNADVISDGTVFGAIQITGDGMPVILTADRGATGGYTKIAVVITSDLWKVAQALPGDTVSFRSISVEGAQDRLRNQVNQLAELRQYVTENHQYKSNMKRIMVDEQPYLVMDETGMIVTQLDPFDEESSSSVNTISVTINDRSYSFDVQIEIP